MVSRFTTTRILKIAVPALVAIFCVNSVLPAAARTRRVRPISKPKFDPAAKQVELFKGMKDGSLAARLILKNSREGNLLIQNKTDQPLTVKLPDAFVGVQVLKQGGMGMGMNGWRRRWSAGRRRRGRWRTVLRRWVRWRRWRTAGWWCWWRRHGNVLDPAAKSHPAALSRRLPGTRET